MSDFADLLSLKNIEYYENYPLSGLSTFRTGGNARYAVFPSDTEELVTAVESAVKCGERYEVIGNASNVLFGDAGFEGAVIVTKKSGEIKIDGNRIFCSAGAQLSALSNAAAAAGLSGLEFAFGILGSVGGAVFMNAGAYGGQISDVLVCSEAYDVSEESIIRIGAEEHCFGYRKSVYSENRNLICLSAAFELACGDSEKIFGLMRANMAKRREKQPLEYPSAGSFFKRPEGFYAGKLIEECGLKGLKVGGAAVSEKHAGFIINTGGARSSDIKELAEQVVRIVFEKTGVMLEAEVRYIF